MLEQRLADIKHVTLFVVQCLFSYGCSLVGVNMSYYHMSIRMPLTKMPLSVSLISVLLSFNINCTPKSIAQSFAQWESFFLTPIFQGYFCSEGSVQLPFLFCLHLLICQLLGKTSLAFFNLFTHLYCISHVTLKYDLRVLSGMEIPSLSRSSIMLQLRSIFQVDIKPRTLSGKHDLEMKLRMW